MDVVVSYDAADENLQQELEVHLAAMRRQGLIRWFVRDLLDVANAVRFLSSGAAERR